MNFDHHYGGIIWTNHALERLKQRMLRQDMALDAFRRPDAVVAGKQPGTKEYQKNVGKSLITIIAMQNDKREWVIVSCWVDPPLAGSIDILKKNAYKQYQKAGFWGKFWIELKSQLGLIKTYK